MNPPGSLAGILQNFVNLIGLHAGFFQATSNAMYASSCLLVLMLYGSKILGKRDWDDWHEWAMLLIRFGVCSMLTVGWNASIPGFAGEKGYQIIANLGSHYANQLERGLAQRVFSALGELYWNMETPWLAILSGGINIQELFTYGIVMLFVLLFGGVVLYVTLVGLMGTGIGIIIGPLLFNFLLIPNFEYMFWNWLRAFVTYSLFYPLCAFCFLFVFGNFIIDFVHSNPQGNLTELGVQSLYFVCVLMGSIGVALKIPSIAGSYASGSGGQGTPWVNATI